MPTPSGTAQVRPLPEKGPAAVSGPAAAAAEGDLGDDPVDAAACACRRWVYLSNSACALFGAAGFGVVVVVRAMAVSSCL
jgi:hypothetical protein